MKSREGPITFLATIREQIILWSLSVPRVFISSINMLSFGKKNRNSKHHSNVELLPSPVLGCCRWGGFRQWDEFIFQEGVFTAPSLLTRLLLTPPGLKRGGKKSRSCSHCPAHSPRTQSRVPMTRTCKHPNSTLQDFLWPPQPTPCASREGQNF